MTPGLPTDLLKTFLVLVRTKSYSRTGEIIGRSQSAVSLQMRRLQDTAGSALFTEAGKQMELSEQGRILHDYAQQIVRLSDECLARLQGEFVVDTIRIGIPSDFAITYLPRILGRFVDANPNISLDVRCDLSGDLIRRIKDQAYDVVLCLYDGEPHRLLRKTWREPVVWVGEPGHALAKRRPLPLVLFPDGCQYRERVLKSLRRADIKHKIVYSSANLTGNQAAIEAGLGLTALSQLTIPPGLHELDEPGDLPELEDANIALYWNPKGATRATQELVGFLGGALNHKFETADAQSVA